MYRHPGDPAVTTRPFRPANVLMLLMNAYDPDPRVRQEALALIRMGCRVRLLAWDRDLAHSAEEIMEEVDVKRVFLRSAHGRGTTQIFFYAWLYFKMLWIGLRTPFDAVHCHDLDTLPLGYALGKLKRKPVIYDAHESFTDMLSGSVAAPVRRILFAFENFLISRTDLLITVGEVLRRHFAARGASHSVVVGNWKRPEEFARTEEQNSAVRRQLGIPEEALVVVCITQLLSDRKLEELAGAIAASPDTYLILGGKGVLEDSVRQWASANPRIRYIGFVRASEIPVYTCAADVVYYGFDPANPNARFSAPNKLFEALAAGRPLITGDFGEIAAVVRQAECGIVLPEYSDMAVRKALDALRDPELRGRMAENARRFGSTFMNWEKAEEILHREYSALLPSPLQRPVVAAGEA